MQVAKLQNLLRSNLVLGIAALLAGAVAAWLGAQQIERRAATVEREARQRFASGTFVVAARDVPKGQKIDASYLAARSMPKAYVPSDALTPEAAGSLIGGRAAIDMRRGTPVLRSALVAENKPGRLSEHLPLGMRALTIQVDQVNALSGHLEAGDSVDLYYSRTQGGGAVLIPLLQRVRVLATGTITERDRENELADTALGEFGSVTLLVSANDAQRIVLAEQTGRLTLLLRRPADDGTVQPRTLDSTQLWSVGREGRRSGFAESSTVELLVGGNGGSPQRSWLRVGLKMQAQRGAGA